MRDNTHIRRFGIGKRLGVWAMVWLGVAAANPVVASTGPPHIVLFVIDTLRADRLGAYGYERPTSPHIDALARESVTFTRADAAAPWTLPSVVSMMTSRYPVEHGVIGQVQKVAPDRPVLAEFLTESGYETHSYYANEFAGSASGLDRGFDHAELVTHTGHEGVTSFLESRDRERPFFLYIHNVEPHNPWELAVARRYVEPFGKVTFEDRLQMLDLYVDFRSATRRGANKLQEGSKVQARLLEELRAIKEDTVDILYDASVRLADQRVGETIAALRRAGLWENTLFLLTSDHGEEMGEHGGWQHDQSVYPELVHVPFIMRLPRGHLGGTRRDHPVTLVDVLPTLLDVVGHPVPPDASGISLMSYLDDAASAVPRLRFTAQRANVLKHYAPFKAQRGDINLVVHEGPWKGIWNVEHDTMELYRVAEDPGNRHDRAKEHPDIVRRLKEVLRQRFGLPRVDNLEQSGPDTELSPEQRENFEALGYL